MMVSAGESKVVSPSESKVLSETRANDPVSGPRIAATAACPNAAEVGRLCRDTGFCRGIQVSAGDTDGVVALMLGRSELEST